MAQQHGTPAYDAKTAVDCLVTGEPTFLLRAQDKHAADTVREWASRVQSVDMQREALNIAHAMDAWPVKKEPD